ncbi:hypothetical protein LTR84_000612 [Exophiala bonariae]|uniref:Major facilitator superfamily (MFS) profile domain-containing protein n=1 Tax=Exophiala bonariae TaxID=1690606 RepID=A0AAV9NUS3_9EURO|nr:hypothetical protein LTR84_000612 [Exophiala bonariae]
MSQPKKSVNMEPAPMPNQPDGDSKVSMIELGSTIMIDPIKEKKMMRKFDRYALLLIGIMYMFCNLDRGNLGNASIAGMPKDIGLVGNQFGTAVTLLFATYVPFEAPVAILVKIVGPKPLLAGCCTSWGLVTLCMGFIQNWKGLYTCRLLLGAFEAGLIPCLETYLGLVYKKEERGTRMVMVYSWSAIASAFGGLLAYGLTQINGPGEFQGWRWLFIVEGILTLCIIPVFLWLFPKDILDAWFLTPEEKELMRLRYIQNPSWGIDEKFTWGETLKVFKDLKFYAFVAILYCGDLTIYSFTTFLPAILKGMGYTSVHANLLTVPVYVWALGVFIVAGISSDRFKNRSIPIGGGFVCMIVGYAILISVETVGVRYFACYVAMGIYPTVALLIMWLCDNVARHFKRASMIGLCLTLANTSGVVTGQIFTTPTSPRYIRGLSICMGLAVFGLLVVVALVVGFKIVNRRREQAIAQAERDGTPLISCPEHGDYDESARYLESLEEKANMQQERVSTTPPHEPSDNSIRLSQPPSSETMASEAGNPLVAQRPQLVQSAYLSRPVYLGDASGIAFGMKLRESIRGHDGVVSLRTEHRYFNDPGILRRVADSYELPEKSYALILVRLVKRFLGDTHHLNLGSAFLERVDDFYVIRVEDPIWICRLFVIYALGELYSNGPVSASTERKIPGTAFFLTAMSLLQDNYEDATILYVETLMLVSLYFDALNRTNSAYAYIGLALRVSLTLGLHRNISSHQLPAVEREHRNRVWWTVHYLERLCSSKHGHPMMLRDEDISTSLPSWEGLSPAERAEFPNPSILNAQLNLAKIVGFISRDMYVVSGLSRGQTFLQTVHSIFTRLKDWNESLPVENKMDSSVTASRGISSLHLLFNQCVILATRPILYLIFQQCFRTTAESAARSNSIPPIARALADHCVYAARNINHILIQLWVDGSIALFGYTDALILFTSTMALTIAVALRLGNVDEVKSETETAWRLLGQMRECGNNAAAEFHEQLNFLRQDLGLVVPETAQAPSKTSEHDVIQCLGEEATHHPSGAPALDLVNSAMTENRLVSHAHAPAPENASAAIYHYSGEGEGSWTWDGLGDRQQLTSFYLQGDSHTDFRSAVYGHPLGESVDMNPVMALSGSSEARVNGSIGGDTAAAAAAAAEHPQDFQSSDAFASDVLLNSMPFGLDLSELDGFDVDQMPFLWT